MISLSLLIINKNTKDQKQPKNYNKFYNLCRVKNMNGSRNSKKW